MSKPDEFFHTASERANALTPDDLGKTGWGPRRLPPPGRKLSATEARDKACRKFHKAMRLLSK